MAYSVVFSLSIMSARPETDTIFHLHYSQRGTKLTLFYLVQGR